MADVELSACQTITARPAVWIGAYSPGALALPPAHPTPAQLYAPRGVYCDDEVLIVADSGNHRVLIWHGVPTEDGQPADVVLGQPDFFSEGPNAAGRGAANGLHLPTGVGVYAGKLYVADAWHHRILFWNSVPTESFCPPDGVLGQTALTDTSENRDGPVDAHGFYWPYGIAFIAGRFYVTDTGNRRVLGWHGLPEPNQPPDLIMGQPAANERQENRGGPVGPDTFRWPHAVVGDEHLLYVADAGNHRLLGWSPSPTADCPADVVLGQPDFTRAQEWPYGPQGPQRLRFPYAAAYADGLLAVADTANNRVLMWQHPPRTGAFHAAAAVLGQPDFDANGENRWSMIDRDTLCWPYGIHLHNGRLVVADSGNNRVMIWTITHSASTEEAAQ